MKDYILSHQASIFGVADMESSIKFYTQKLGFALTFSWEDPPTYAVLKREEISIHLTQRDQDTFDLGSIYIFCYDIEALYQEYQQKNLGIAEPLRVTDYGMKEFTIFDLDRNRLIFGKGTNTD